MLFPSGWATKGRLWQTVKKKNPTRGRDIKGHKSTTITQMGGSPPNKRKKVPIYTLHLESAKLHVKNEILCKALTLPYHHFKQSLNEMTVIQTDFDKMLHTRDGPIRFRYLERRPNCFD